MSRPGKSTTAGQHWVYRLQGHRKCWFLTAEETPVKRQVRHRAAKPRLNASEENDAAGKRRAVVDARAELLRSVPAETSQPTRPAPELKMADAASVLATAIAAFVPPASVENFGTPDRRTPRQVDVEMLLAAAPADRGAVAASAPAAASIAFPVDEAADDGPGWMATWLGALLMALGLISVLGSSRIVREAVLLRG